MLTASVDPDIDCEPGLSYTIGATVSQNLSGLTLSPQVATATSCNDVVTLLTFTVPQDTNDNNGRSVAFKLKTPDAGSNDDRFTQGQPIIRVVIEDDDGIGTSITAKNDVADTIGTAAVEIYVLANDACFEGAESRLAVSEIYRDPANGTAAIIDSGKKVRYTANSGFSGEDSFTYIVADGSHASAFGTVTVTVAAPDGPRWLAGAVRLLER